MRYHSNTVVESLNEYLRGWVDSLDPSTIHFMLEITALVVVPLALCGLGFLVSVKNASQNSPQSPATGSQCPAPNRWVQSCLFVIGELIAIGLPLNKIEIYDTTARLWTCAICLLITFFGPICLGFLIVPDAALQKNTIRNIYVIIFVLGLWQLIRGACP